MLGWWGQGRGQGNGGQGMCQVSGGQVVGVRVVDLSHPVRPSKSRTRTSDKMKKLVLENHRISRGELAQEMSISLK